MNLKNEFNDFFKNNFGNIELSAPVFFEFPISIRFEIGVDLGNSDDLDSYIETSMKRSIDIFSELFNPNDILYIVVESPCKDLDNINVIHPLLLDILDECSYEVSSSKDNFLRERYVIKSTTKSVKIAELLKKIICSELDGTNTLSGNVYILNSKTGVLYYLYDDRGLDVAAPLTENLQMVYNRYNSWILNHNKEKISKIFENKQKENIEV